MAQDSCFKNSQSANHKTLDNTIPEPLIEDLHTNIVQIYLLSFLIGREGFFHVLSQPIYSKQIDFILLYFSKQMWYIQRNSVTLINAGYFEVAFSYTSSIWLNHVPEDDLSPHFHLYISSVSLWISISFILSILSIYQIISFSIVVMSPHHLLYYMTLLIIVFLIISPEVLPNGKLVQRLLYHRFIRHLLTTYRTARLVTISLILSK